jgi:hypothetical protein
MKEDKIRLRATLKRKPILKSFKLDFFKRPKLEQEKLLGEKANEFVFPFFFECFKKLIENWEEKILFLG